MESTVEKNACLDFAVRSLERVPTREESLKLSAYSTQTLVAAAKEATIEFADRVFNFLRHHQCQIRPLFGRLRLVLPVAAFCHRHSHLSAHQCRHGARSCKTSTGKRSHAIFARDERPKALCA